MEKLKLHSPELSDSNIAWVAERFPDCMTESEDIDGSPKRSIDFDLLRQKLSTDLVEGPQERYRLDWPGKREALATANAPIAKTLRPSPKESVDFDSTENLFIEGDNLEALKLLQETYLNKIKIVYVDPPYNTGNDFVYQDKFAEKIGGYLDRSNQVNSTGERLVANPEVSGRMHSNWLTMIYPRLILARNLLSDDGAIFISIDDNEVHSLLTICHEVFGRENFLGLIPIIKNRKGLNSGSFHAVTHEYLVAFQKINFESLGLPKSEESIAEYDQEHADGRRFKWDDLRKRGGEDREEDREGMSFPIFVEEETGEVSLEATDQHTK
jgi:adenine-specific DNA-methyltransferase